MARPLRIEFCGGFKSHDRSSYVAFLKNHYEQLKPQSQISNVSISEIIRQAVEKDLNKNADKNARLFFNTLSPLQSFANTDAVQYVDDLRTTSRIVQCNKSNEAADL